jgi:hypothetical protein
MQLLLAVKHTDALDISITYHFSYAARTKALAQGALTSSRSMNFWILPVDVFGKAP